MPRQETPLYIYTYIYNRLLAFTWTSLWGCKLRKINHFLPCCCWLINLEILFFYVLRLGLSDSAHVGEKLLVGNVHVFVVIYV